MHEESEIDIHIVLEESHYDGDSTYDAVITLACAGKSVKMEYHGDYEDKAVSSLLSYIEGCIRYRDEWIGEMLLKGPDTVAKLKQLEDEEQEYIRDAASYRKHAETKQQIAQKKRAEIDKLKAQLEGK